MMEYKILIVSLLAIAIVIAAMVYFKSPLFLKWYGRYQIRSANNYLLESQDYYLMKDVVLLTFEGLQKIDFIIVSRFGVFVVMVQHYRGEIGGLEYQPEWYQKLRNKDEIKFANPNAVIAERVKTITTLLNIPKEHIFPVALFIGISGFESKLNARFTFGANYIKYIRSKGKHVFSAEQVDQYITKIDAKRKRQGLMNEYDRIEKSQQEVSPLKSENICPKCGSAMQAKNSDSNDNKLILVCTLFPTCRYRRKL